MLEERERVEEVEKACGGGRKEERKKGRQAVGKVEQGKQEKAGQGGKGGKARALLGFKLIALEPTHQVQRREERDVGRRSDGVGEASLRSQGNQKQASKYRR